MKAYKVYRCNIDGFSVWSGVVLDVNDEGAIPAIRKKFGVKSLLEEKHSEYIDKKIEEIDPNTISVSELTIGELADFEANYRTNNEQRYSVSLEDRTRFTGELIDIFENYLYEKGVSIDNPDRDNDNDSAAIIYGTDYYGLSDKIEHFLEQWKVLEPIIHDNRSDELLKTVIDNLCLDEDREIVKKQLKQLGFSSQEISKFL